MFGIEVGRTAELDDLQAIRAIDKASLIDCPNGLQIVELRCPADLYAEHIALAHCIDSYDQAAYRGDCRLLSVREAGRPLASAELELRREHGEPLGRPWNPQHLSTVQLRKLDNDPVPADSPAGQAYRWFMERGIGRLGAIEGARDSLVYRYDERGNLVEQVRSIRLDQQTLLDRVTYRYDAANQLLEIGYPSGLAIGYPRNAGGQVASVTLAVGDKAPSPLVGQIAYLPFGPLQRLTWGNGICVAL